MDTWLHLRVGQYLLDGHRFTAGQPDPWVVLADRTYVSTQWLAQMVGGAVDRTAGLRGIQALYAVSVAGLIAVMVCLIRSNGAMPLVPLLLPAALLASLANISPRPQLAGLVLLGIVILLWNSARLNGQARWLLVPFSYLFACLHGLWSVALAVGLVMVIAARLDRRNQPGDQRHLFTVWLACVGVTTVTPIGPRLLVLPLTVSQSARIFADEWQPPGLGSPFYLMLLALAAVTAVAILIQGRRGEPHLLGSIFLVIVAVGMATSMQRLVTPAVLLLLPVLSASLTSTLRLPPAKPVARSERAMWVGGGALAAGVLITSIVGVQVILPVSPRIDSAMDSVPSESRLVADPRLTGWVIYRHPHLHALTDLRFELYDTDTVERADDTLAAQGDWQGWLADNDVDYALLDINGPLAAALIDAGQWQALARDGSYVLLARGRVSSST